MNKLSKVEDVVALLKDGMTIMVGGFLGQGSAQKVIDAICESSVKDLTVIANDASYTDRGVGKLLVTGKVKKFIVSHIGTNPTVGDMLNAGTLEIEFVPQGTLAERIRSGGAGLGGVLTPVGIGTVVENGKQKIEVDGVTYLLEKPLHADMAIIGASISDKIGNLFYKGTCQNFNPLMATAADIVVAETEELVETGEIAMESVHVPAILVNYIITK